MKPLSINFLPLLISGLLIISLTQLVARYFVIEDFWRGAFSGVGIGLLLLAVWIKARK